jgi:zinc D-Ala-D-Ala carboxypeptidase
MATRSSVPPAIRLFLVGTILVAAIGIGACHPFSPSKSAALDHTLDHAPGPPVLELGGSSRSTQASTDDGKVPEGVTIFDTRYPAVTRLDPSLLAALRRAASDAGRSGVQFTVDSGWRSPRYQQQLFDEAVAKYGSREEAARWVASPDTSAHVSGDAVDLASGAAKWLSKHGATYGLCQTYANESWHYELRPDAPDHGCPEMYADPTHDPRMQ